MRANFEVVSSTEKALVIRDLWPVTKSGLTVTNDAENVVAKLVRDGTLKDGQLLFYYDSDGQLDELVVKKGEFSHFAPGPRRC